MTVRLHSSTDNACLALSGSIRDDIRASEQIAAFLAHHSVPTPFIVIDLDAVRSRWAAFHAQFPQARILYAVKANPAAEIIGALAAFGADFDLASAGEINRCRSLGINPDRLSFGNTVKREADIAKAYEAGINLFAFDSSDELEKLARAAPGAGAFCRILVHTAQAQWPLTRKFGCSSEMAVELLQRAKSLGLRPIGLSFHVGSQQIDPTQWSGAIASAARIIRTCERSGLKLKSLNVGGGFPSQYRDPIPPVEAYAEAINAALTQHFGNSVPHITVEPGRHIVGDAGVLRTEVLAGRPQVMQSHGAMGLHRRRPLQWACRDAGRANSLSFAHSP